MNESESRVSFPALGSIAVVAVAQPARLALARDSVARTVAAFDVACSRFREDSELSALNAAAGNAMRVGSLLLEAVREALRAARLTEGDVDPTVGQALIALGYDRDFEQLQSVQARSRTISFVPVPGWRSIEIDDDASTIRVPRGVTLDLGATAKALAADHAARSAAALAGCGVLVSLGGDISIAGPAPDSGWRVRVTDDHRAGTDAPGQWITLRSGGLATSSTTVRRWQLGVHKAHHLLDPASGRPVSSAWRTASVCAATCLDANIASTAAIIRGERAVAWLRELELPSRLVGVDASVRHLAGWPSDGDDLAAVREPTPVYAGEVPQWAA
jgi:thiamine biosynthesis lipoprotein